MGRTLVRMNCRALQSSIASLDLTSTPASATSSSIRASSMPAARIPGRHFLLNLIARRSLLFELVRRDFHQRFVGSAAGWLWGVIHPLVMLLCWTFVFRICMRFQLPPDAPTDNYVL